MLETSKFYEESKFMEYERANCMENQESSENSLLNDRKGFSGVHQNSRDSKEMHWDSKKIAYRFLLETNQIYWKEMWLKCIETY